MSELGTLQTTFPDSFANSLAFCWDLTKGFPAGSSGKEPACHCRRHRDMGLSWEDPPGGGSPYCKIPAWRIPWTEEPGGLLSIGHQETDRTEAT